MRDFHVHEKCLILFFSMAHTNSELRTIAQISKKTSYTGLTSFSC